MAGSKLFGYRKCYGCANLSEAKDSPIRWRCRVNQQTGMAFPTKRGPMVPVEFRSGCYEEKGRGCFAGRSAAEA